MRAAILGLAIGIYLGAGLYSGLLMQRAIPALSPAGVAWITATWPNVIRCARSEAECDPTGPKWMRPYLFSFGGTDGN